MSLLGRKFTRSLFLAISSLTAVMPIPASAQGGGGRGGMSSATADGLHSACSRLASSSKPENTSFKGISGDSDIKQTLTFAGQRVRSACLQEDGLQELAAISTTKLVDDYLGTVRLVRGLGSLQAMENELVGERFVAVRSGVCSDSALNVVAIAKVGGIPIALHGGYALATWTVAGRSLYFWTELENGSAVIPSPRSDYQLTIVAYGSASAFRRSVTVVRDDVIQEKVTGQCLRAIELDRVT